MAIKINNTNSLDSHSILDKAVKQILGGHQEGALARLAKSGCFNDAQIAKVQETLIKLNASHLILTPLELKDRILEALNPKTQATEISPQNKAQHLCFIETASKSILEDLYKTPAFLSFSQSIQKGSSITHRAKSFYQPVRENPSFELCGKSYTRLWNEDIIGKIFEQCLPNSIAVARALACTNKYFNKNIMSSASNIDLQLLCPRLTILDAKAQGLKVEDEPALNKLAVLKCYQDLAPLVEDDAGLTLLTMPEGGTLNQLMAIAEKAGITVAFDFDIINGLDRIIRNLRNASVEHTYRVVITNDIFINSRLVNSRKTYYTPQEKDEFKCQEKLVQENGCSFPTIQEYIALCIFQKIINEKYPYGSTKGNFGRSSTGFDGCRCNPLFVGKFSTKRIEIYEFVNPLFSPTLGSARRLGAAGRRIVG